MRTAKEMYSFCKTKQFGTGTTKSWALKHYSVIEKSLAKDEDVVMCFMGLHNYVSPTKHNGNFAYAVTNKRIVVAQKKLIGQVLQSIYLDNINDIAFESGMMFGVIAIDTIKEVFNVALDKKQASNINTEIHDLLHKLKQKEQSPTLFATLDPTAELKKYKELLDSNVITQEDFDAKKRQLLNL